MRRKKSARGGFTLAETLMVVLILLMVSGVVAAGIPAAANALNKVVEASNAQLLLSTTMTKLRTELGTATEVSVNGTTVTYRTPEGSQSVLTSEQSGIFLREYADIYTTDDKYKHLLVSSAAANDPAAVRGLCMSYTGVAESDGVITFTNLNVYRQSDTAKSSPLVSAPTYQIRVMSDLG